MKSILPIILLVVFISGCTSATKEQLNKPVPSKPQISKTVSQEKQGLKRLVAIARFSDETKRSNGLFSNVDKNGNRLGKQASDILASRLTASNKFIMLERSDFSLVEQEGQSREKIGTDFILLGSISEFGRETKSEVGVFSRNKIQEARATVNVRLVNVKTSEVIYSEEATGTAISEANRVFGVGETAAYNSALDDKAISAAISKLVANIMNNLLDQPWQSYILGQDGDNLIIAGGKSQGLTVGTKLNVYKPGNSVKNPQSGKLIELPGNTVASIEIIANAGKGDNEISFAKVVDGNIAKEELSTYRVVEL